MTILELFSGEVSSVITNVFFYMEIAEKLIQEYKDKYPEQVGEFHNSFMALAPPKEMIGLIPDIYEAHCREILERVKNGNKLNRGTDAECLVLIQNVSLKVPPNSSLQAVYYHLFKKILGDEKADRIYPDWQPKEDYQGQIKEEINVLKDKIGRRR